MPTITDHEFGPIPVKVSAIAKYARLKMAPSGALSATLPRRAPLSLITRLIDESRPRLRKNLSKIVIQQPFVDGSEIGKSHRLKIVHAAVSTPSRRTSQQILIVTLPLNLAIESTAAQGYLEQSQRYVLRREAKAYLPRQVAYLAQKYGFKTPTLRFTSAKTRWGSCSSSGNINLNVNIMSLPLELIDYVIVHELCHTSQMNHSPDFWQLVSDCLPNYKALRKQLKSYSPYR